jgi:hypothetical protein
METTIQAGNKRMKIASVPIVTNPNQESRLFRNSWHHMARSGEAIIVAILCLRLKFFGSIGMVLFVSGSIPFVYYGVNIIIDKHPGAHIQSLILGVVLVTAALLSFALGIIADLLRINRTLHEDTLERLKRIEFGKKPE